MGGVPRRQAVAVRAARDGPANPAKDDSAPALAEGRDRQRRRPDAPARSSASPRRPAPRILTYGTRPARRRPGDPTSRRTPGGLRIAYDAPRRRGDARAPPRRPVQRPQRARGRRPRRGARARPGGGPGGPRVASSGVPGRMERLDAGQPFGVVIDYAHSPASLEKVLDAPRPARGGPRRRADRGVRVGGGAGHREAADDGPDRRRAGAARRRHRRGPARRGPRRDPRARSPAAPRTPAGGATATCCSSPTGRRRSRPRSSGPGPATSSCSPGKGHEHVDHRPRRAGRRTTSGDAAEAALARARLRRRRLSRARLPVRPRPRRVVRPRGRGLVRLARRSPRPSSRPRSRAPASTPTIVDVTVDVRPAARRSLSAGPTASTISGDRRRRWNGLDAATLDLTLDATSTSSPGRRPDQADGGSTASSSPTATARPTADVDIAGAGRRGGATITSTARRSSAMAVEAFDAEARRRRRARRWSRRTSSGSTRRATVDGGRRARAIGAGRLAGSCRRRSATVTVLDAQPVAEPDHLDRARVAVDGPVRCDR